MITQREIDAFAILVRKKSVDGVTMDGVVYRKKRVGDRLVLSSPDKVFEQLVFTEQSPPQDP